MIYKLFKKYEELVMYGVFGLLTTVVNVIIFYILNYLFDISFFENYSYIFASIMAWIGAVVFAFITNKHFVFKVKETSGTFKEFCKFISFRILSLLFDLFIMFILVDIFIVNDLVSKIIANIFVVILNYFFSKIFVFKKSS